MPASESGARAGQRVSALFNKSEHAPVDCPGKVLESFQPDDLLASIAPKQRVVTRFLGAGEDVIVVFSSPSDGDDRAGCEWHPKVNDHSQEKRSNKITSTTSIRE